MASATWIASEAASRAGSGPSRVVHREVGQAVLVADLVNPDDAGMAEPCDRFRLGTKTTAILGPSQGSIPEDLDGDLAIQAALARAVHDAHPPSRDFLEQVVVPETTEGRRRRDLGADGIALRLGSENQARNASRARTAREPGAAPWAPTFRKCRVAVHRTGSETGLGSNRVILPGSKPETQPAMTPPGPISESRPP